MWKRIWILFQIRNKEFYRDRSALGWNLLFPFFVIIGFTLLFNGGSKPLFKVGVIEAGKAIASVESPQYRNFRAMRHVEFIPFRSLGSALAKLMHHRVDLVISPEAGKYWISSSSPNSAVVEKLLIAASADDVKTPQFIKQTVIGREVPYVEWLFPGILGMNMMFSSLFGVGYVVVTYRKNGVLKRLSVTPVRPHEFLTAQIASRMFLLLITTAIVFIGCMVLYGFECRGSYLALFSVFALGGFSMISLGLVVASRSGSEEFAGGVLNIITWPMMFLSEVWFTLEGAKPWVQKVAQLFPLTHMIDASRQIMNDGAGLVDVRYQLIVMAGMAALFLGSGSIMFKWQK